MPDYVISTLAFQPLIQITPTPTLPYSIHVQAHIYVTGQQMGGMVRIHPGYTMVKSGYFYAFHPLQDFALPVYQHCS
jgi:hypothetical protein